MGMSTNLDLTIPATLIEGIKENTDGPVYPAAI